MALDNNTQLVYTDKTTLKNWFKTGLKPKQDQFWAQFDSYWHKSESLPISSITNLGNLLDNKAEANHSHDIYAKNDASSLTNENVLSWQQKLGVDDLNYVEIPTTDATGETHPYVVVVNTEGNSARRGVNDFGKVDTVNNIEPDENKNVNVGLDDVLTKGSETTKSFSQKVSFNDEVVVTKDFSVHSSDLGANRIYVSDASTKKVEQKTTQDYTGFFYEGNLDNSKYQSANRISIGKIGSNSTQDIVGINFSYPKLGSGFNNLRLEGIPFQGSNPLMTTNLVQKFQAKSGTIALITDIQDVYEKPTNWTNASQRFSGLVDKSADATYDKVMVLDSEGKAGVKDANDFGNVKTVNGNSSDSTGNTDIGIDDTLRVNNITERIIEFEDGGITLDVIDEQDLVSKKFFAYSVREEGIFQIGTGCGHSTGWAAPTFFGHSSLKKLNHNNTTAESSGLTAYGYSSLKEFNGGRNGGITSIGSNTLIKFVGTNDQLPAKSYFMTALGANALYDFLNGNRNTALGGSSGRFLVTGSNNTFTGAASMQGLEEGSNNTAMGYQVALDLKKGSNNTFIGANIRLNKEEVDGTVIIADGTGKQHFKSDDKGSILPYQTIALIDADETGKAIITKEFVDSKISNFKLPTDWESPQQRFSGLVDKSADATYNKVMVLDSEGKAGMKDVNEAYLNPDTLINILESATTEQIITIREILYPQI